MYQLSTRIHNNERKQIQESTLLFKNNDNQKQGQSIKPMHMEGFYVYHSVTIGIVLHNVSIIHQKLYLTYSH